MENRVYGIITIGIAVALYALAFKNYRKESYNTCLAFIILGGLILRIYTSLDFYLHEWDERYHALVAKNLLQYPLQPMLYTTPLLDYDYKDWAGNHIWVHKQPLPLYSIALSMLILGKNTIALRMPSIILSTLSIFGTFHIGRILSSKKVGLLAAFLFSINGLIIESTAGRVATDHIDVFFYSLITMAVYFLLSSVEINSTKSLVAGATLTGLAILSKWLPALIVLPIWLIYYYQKRGLQAVFKKLLLFVLLVTLIVLPWQLYIIHHFPLEAAWEYAYNKKHLFEALGPHGKPFYFHLARMPVIFGELIYLPLLWLIFTTHSQTVKRNYTKLILLGWILVPYLFFSVAVTKMQGYILFCSTAIFIMTALFFFELRSYKTKYKKTKQLFLILLIALPIRYSIERVKPFSVRDRSPVWISEMKIIDKSQPNKAVVFNCKYPIETMFHTELIAYETIPNLEKLKAIHSEGYEIFMDNHRTIKKEISVLEFATYLEITGDK